MTIGGILIDPIVLAILVLFLTGLFLAISNELKITYSRRANLVGLALLLYVIGVVLLEYL